MKIIAFTFLSVFSIQTLFSQNNYLNQWPGFRGPFAKGFIENSATVENWNLGTGENILWQTPIPGLGHSSPVVWDNKIFVTTAISGSGENYLKVGLYGDGDAVDDDSEHEFKIYCLDKNTGKIIWERLAFKGTPAVKRHTKASHADCTPATDGKHVLAFFGSQGLYCYDFEGNLVWEKQLGKMNSGPYNAPELEWGFSSSPIIYKGKVIVQCDFLGDGFLASFDVETGKQIWRTSRDEVSTWSSPTVFEKGGKSQIVVNGWKHMGGYDFETGREIWRMSGGGDIPAPTPVFENDLIFINNAHGRFAPIYAITPSAKGDITLAEDELSNDYIVWSVKRGGAYMQTPLVYRGYLYNLQGNGSLTVYKATTGEEMYKQSLGAVGGFSASGVASGDNLYFCAEKGDVFVVKAGEEFKEILHTTMNDVLMASPAISENVIYFRAQKSLIAVGTK
ncbi:outer membrane protein assembly factor BamB family protein [Maribellus maritimus]|uniref:outer membrane protein assembly factor BamB family protein n=1 Tax=Maribellus maritimus TaxID=2870838 RepID=UPI001EEC6449|nr:PQQ-binding-like beta-propeller repeat protein [Maribellus maritimus]MCG6187765.1 PQQ-binding-like beta-propeller repeat protein [Maribellus maritimus]